MQSTIENPIAFFQDFIFNNFEAYINKLIEDFRKCDFPIISINKERYEIKYLYYDDDGGYQATHSYFSKLKGMLYAEYQYSLKLIDKSCLQYMEEGRDYSNYLLMQGKTIKFIIKRAKAKIEKYPILFKPLEGIANYINKKYLEDKKETELIKLDSIDVNNNIDFNSTTDIIYTVLGYLKDHNNRREKIMSDEQFDLMIRYVNEFVATNQIPSIENKIRPIKISKNLLRFTFWVLHKHLYTTRPLRDDFIQFIQSLFQDFEIWECSTIKKKFGNKDAVNPRGQKFIPHIIKVELSA